MNHLPTIVGLGETLWDVFPDGPRLGGAPLNFSCSAAELASDDARVCLVSSVGNDELGQRARATLKQHSVSTSFVQSSDRETGQVLVELDSAGVASYRFADDAAWDHLAWTDDLQQLAADCNAVCFGTLGQRSEQSKTTIQKFLAATATDTLRIFDINLRPPFFHNDLILESLALANVLKLNDDELPHLATLCQIEGDVVEVMQQLATKFQLRCVATTRGAAGAVLVSGSDVSELTGIKVDVVDTVGAGDAFTAAMTLGLLARRPIDSVNHTAIATAAYVCARPGATMELPPNLLND